MSARLLIIDNEPGMLMSLSMLIGENTPHKVMTTNNPLEAIEAVRQGGFDLIITGLKLPVIDGIELLEAVRQINRDMPVIIMANYGTFGSAMEAMFKGGFDFITIPFRNEQMLFAIDKALKLVKLTKENRALKERLKNIESLTAAH
jgi:two-component system NtrC family response regulator